MVDDSDDVDDTINQFMDKYFASALPDDPEKYDAKASRARAQGLISARVLFNKSFERRIAEANRQCNILLPIYQLPEEVMATILSFAVEEMPHSPRDHYYQRLKTLAQVSRDWKNLVFNTPSLWAYLHPEMNSDLVQAALRKAKSSTFTIVHFGSFHRAAEPFLRVVKPLIGRLRIIRWTLDSSSDPAISMFQHAAPAVEKLELHLAGGNSAAPIDLFDGAAPRLRAIQLISFPILWTSPILSGLQSLKLHHISSSGPSVDSIFTVLSNSPFLAAFNLDTVVLTRRDPESPLSVPIELTHLVDFRLTDIASDVVHHLLSGLRFSKCENLVVRCQMEERAPDTVLGDSVQHMFPILQKAMTATPMVQFTIGERVFEIAASYKADHFRGAFVCFEMSGTARAIEAFHWFVSGVGTSLQARPASILLAEFHGLNRDVEVSKSIATVFDRLPGTVELETRVYDDIRSIVKILSDPVEHNGILRWRLPELHTLDVYDSCEAGAIVKMVRYRHGLDNRGKKGKKTKRKPQPILPAKFQRLSFGNRGSIDSYSYEQLEDIVGKGKIHWDYVDGQAEGTDLYDSPMVEDILDFVDFHDDWEISDD